MDFSNQGYWSGVLFPTPGDLPYPGIEPASLVSPALAGGFVTTSATWEPLVGCNLENTAREGGLPWCHVAGFQPDGKPTCKGVWALFFTVVLDLLGISHTNL